MNESGRSYSQATGRIGRAALFYRDADRHLVCGGADRQSGGRDAATGAGGASQRAARRALAGRGRVDFWFLHYDEKGLRRLAIVVALAAWANWLVTLIASFLGVNGLDYTGNRANDIIAFLLQSLVVLPTLVGSGFWAWGFKGKAEG